MKKYLSTLHGKLVLIIITATLPTLLFSFVGLGYLFHFAKQHAQEVLSYKSYFAKEMTQEILFFYEEEMLLLYDMLYDDKELNIHYVSQQVDMLIKNSDRLKNIIILDTIGEVIVEVTPVDEVIVAHILDKMHKNVDSSHIQVGKSLVTNTAILLPLSLRMNDPRYGTYTIIFLLDWVRMLDHIQLKSDFTPSSRFIEMRKTYYHLAYLGYMGEEVEILAESENIFQVDDRMEFLPHLGIYRITATDSTKYLVHDEMVYNDTQGMILLSVSQIDYPWYHHFWYVVYIFGIMLVFITLMASLFGYFILKQMMLKDIEGILSTVDEVGKGNFVARASVADEESLGILASGINTMVEHLAKKTNKLIKVAHTDELTKIYNRRYFMEQASAYLLENTLASIIFFDIDSFKKFNDTYGHAVGDEVLMRLAQLIDENIRKSDIFARYGGEEFVILLKDAEASMAVGVAEHLRGMIQSYEFNLPPHPVFHISISLGVSSNEHRKEKLLLEELIMEADMALYQAKENGRNQVILFGDFSTQKVSPVVEAYHNKDKKK